MTHEGYVHLTVIGRFNRVRALTQDPVAIKEAMVGSTFVEMAPGTMCSQPCLPCAVHAIRFWICSDQLFNVTTACVLTSCIPEKLGLEKLLCCDIL